MVRQWAQHRFNRRRANSYEKQGCASTKPYLLEFMERVGVLVETMLYDIFLLLKIKLLFLI